MKFLKKKSQNDKNKLGGGDEDEITIRMKVREAVEGKFFLCMMTLVTLFALFADDFRLWYFGSYIDVYFYSILIICFFLFGLEIMLNSCVVDEYKYSFFFWLDILATMSLIVDIVWAIQLIETLMQVSSTINSADVEIGTIASQGNSTGKISNVIKSLRLIRLIRIIKLYKYVVQSNSEAEEARLRE